jgi:subtilisin family serine protease
VGVFDTSPFIDALGVEGECDDCFQYLMGGDADRLPTEMSLTVWHDELRPVPNCPGYDRRHRINEQGQGFNPEGQDISNHGLFVAGLVHAVAPSSEIYLVRVLEDDGCGDLFGIYEGIERFIDTTLQERGTLEGTVINLSFGLHRPPDVCRFGLPPAVRSLQTLLREATKRGAVVVAAAGNDSFDRPFDAPKFMEIPAGFPSVIGVAASNRDFERGCFSNVGDVAAPGGDGVSRNGEPPCAIPDCLENSNACVVSLVRKPSPGFANWVGTSFATPLVSGQAARLLKDGVPPNLVFNEIENNVTQTGNPDLGVGIVHLR